MVTSQWTFKCHSSFCHNCKVIKLTHFKWPRSYGNPAISRCQDHSLLPQLVSVQLPWCVLALQEGEREFSDDEQEVLSPSSLICYQASQRIQLTCEHRNTFRKKQGKAYLLGICSLKPFKDAIFSTAHYFGLSLGKPLMFSTVYAGESVPAKTNNHQRWPLIVFYV